MKPNKAKKVTPKTGKLKSTKSMNSIKHGAPTVPAIHAADAVHDEQVGTTDIPDAMLEPPKPPSLFKLLCDECQFMVSIESRRAYAQITSHGRTETVMISPKSEGFHNLVTKVALENGLSLGDIPVGLEFERLCLACIHVAQQDRREAYQRYAAIFDEQMRSIREDTVFYNLHDGCNVIKITPAGASIVPISDCPVIFAKSSSLTKAAPMPNLASRDGLELMRQELNVDRDTWLLIVAFLVSQFTSVLGDDALHMLLVGDSGSGKSILAARIMGIADPQAKGDSAADKKEQDIIVAASKVSVYQRGNLDYIKPEENRLLCTMSTGLREDFRKLYTDDDDFSFHFVRSAILNAKHNVITEDELAQRSVVINVDRFENQKDKRRMERRFDSTVAANALGHLCYLISVYLANYETTVDGYEGLPEEDKTRLTGLASAMLVIEKELGYDSGTYLRLLRHQRNQILRNLLDKWIIGAPLRAFIKNSEGWEGTTADLLARLQSIAGDITRDKNFPRTADRLGTQLGKLKGALRAELGVEYADVRRVGKDNIKTFRKVEVKPEFSYEDFFKGKVNIVRNDESSDPTQYAWAEGLGQVTIDELADAWSSAKGVRNPTDDGKAFTRDLVKRLRLNLTDFDVTDQSDIPDAVLTEGDPPF